MAVLKDRGNWGEQLVAKNCVCPGCKKNSVLRRLPENFKCADLICDFCGYLAQVKTAKVKDIEKLPKRILGGAWRPQQERMEAGIYFSLYVVLTDDDQSNAAIYFLSKDLQVPAMFEARKPLGPSARRAGWQGFTIFPEVVQGRFVRLT